MRAANLLATLVGVTLLAGPAVQGQASKEAQTSKEKDKAQGKAKPPARSYTDEDLKKYKDKPKDDSAPTEAGSEGTSSEAEASPRPRRAREYGGYQELPPAPPGPAEKEQTEAASEPSAATEAQSPEEADWKARAASARRPQQEAQARIAGIESQIADLRDQLNPMSTRYVLGGNSTAGPGQIYEIEEKLRNLESELVGAKADLATAEKAWQQFLDEARAAGASPAWLQP